MNNRIIAVIITAALFMAFALPAFSADNKGPVYETPEGYFENDYKKIVAFLETEDAEGVKNGDKLCSRISSEYDPTDPETWHGEVFYEDQGWADEFGVIWTENEPMRVYSIKCDDCGLCGALDVSGCDELDEISCAFNNLSSIDISGCTALWRLECSQNLLGDKKIVPHVRYFLITSHSLISKSALSSSNINVPFAGVNVSSEKYIFPLML